MAKKKIVDLTPKYYVYYDKKTGRILSVGNEKMPQHEYGIEVTFDEVENLINGNWLFKDYLVGYKRTSDGSSKLAVIPNTEQGYTFKNNVFEWIKESSKPAECTVAWNSQTKTWDFSLSSAIKKVYEDSLLVPKLVFFVTLESDFDFLIRTIFVDTLELIGSDKVSVPFTSKIEDKIDKISISSKLVFKTYKLDIIYE